MSDNKPLSIVYLVRIDEMRNLISQLKEYDDSYFNRNENEVSDFDYDKCFSRLQWLEQKTGVVYSDSPTINVGCEAKSELQKVAHGHSMLSLDKTKSVSDLEAFCSDKDVVFMAKLDGLSISLTYENGELIRGETRGNGFVGEEVTHNAKVFANLPLRISRKDKIVVDGEAIIDYETFQSINKSLPEGKKYKNPRNLVSGSVRQLDSSVAAKRSIRFIAWKFVEGSKSDSFYERLMELKAMGFEIVPSIIYRKQPLNKIQWGAYFKDNDWRVDVKKFISATKTVSNRKGYPIDGVVVCYDSVSYGKSLGATSHHPKHSIAFKFYDESALTTLTSVEWNTTRTGAVNPVAIFDTVQIDGTDVSRASLSNVSIIEELELGYGDEIEVIKANMIIPMVSENLTRSGTVKIPDNCPSCGEKLEIVNSSGRKTLKCKNRDCPAIVVDRFKHFAGKTGLDIAGLSEKTIQKMVDKKMIGGNLYDIFNVTYEELLTLDGFSTISAAKLIDSIEKSKRCRLENALVAIGIPEIGKSTAKLLAKKVYSFQNDDSLLSRGVKEHPLSTFIQMCEQCFVWSKFDGIGNTVETAINVYVIEHKEELSVLANYLCIEESNTTTNKNSLAGNTYCITGSLEVFKNRNELVTLIEDNGGKVVSSVTKKTDFLICNDNSSGSSKLKKAYALGVSVISENELLEIVKA